MVKYIISQFLPYRIPPQHVRQGNPHPDLLGFLSTNEPSVHPVPGSLTWDLRDPGRAGLDVREEAELLFFDPAGHGGARNPEGAREAAQTAAILGGVQDLLAASLWIGMGSRVLAALSSACSTARQLFAIGGMSITYQSLTLTMRAVNSDVTMKGSSFLSTD
jgi:hypothetical protein